ncbi:MAG: aldehyde dehydrogenase family protein [Bacteroidota bacterium]
MPSITTDPITDVFKRMHARFAFVRTRTVAERISILRRLAKRLEEREDDAEQAVFADFRKPAAEVQLSDLLPVYSEIRDAVRNLEQWAKPKRVSAPLVLATTQAELRYEPKGVCLVIAPWNYPILLALGPMISAVAAGNCCVIKPSEHTPHTSAFVASLIAEVFPEDEVTVVEGAVETAQRLLALPFDHIFFTGSTHVGKIVMRAAAEHLTPVTLELGGKSPAVVDRTASIKNAVAAIAMGAFSNTGQTCVRPDYVFVDQRVEREFVEALREQLVAMYGDDPSVSPDFGRLAHAGHVQHVSGLLTEAVEAGARVEVGGGIDVADRYVAPTVLTGVPAGTRILEQEIFGPVLVVMSYTTIEEVIRFINDRPKPLTSYYFGNDKAVSEQFVSNTSAGSTVFNDTLIQFLHPNTPFGGVGASGMGRSHGFAGFETFSNVRPVLRQRMTRSPFQLVYPPYTARVRTIIRQLIDRLFKP